ncbi:MAG: helix-turn-helix transcriptional regulator [Ruminococcus bromii]|nr:helix-turn-helix transcriptional regulator [Ruminococcus bromii]
MKDRIKKLRVKLGKTQMQFADDLNLSRSAIQKWESGETVPDSSSISAIVAKYNVNEMWLRNGVGSDDDMLLTVADEAEWVERIMLGKNEFAKRLFIEFAKLSDEEWMLLKRIVESLNGVQKKGED